MYLVGIDICCSAFPYFQVNVSSFQIFIAPSVQGHLQASTKTIFVGRVLIGRGDVILFLILHIYSNSKNLSSPVHIKASTHVLQV